MINSFFLQKLSFTFDHPIYMSFVGNLALFRTNRTVSLIPRWHVQNSTIKSNFNDDDDDKMRFGCSLIRFHEISGKNAKFSW